MIGEIPGPVPIDAQAPRPRHGRLFKRRPQIRPGPGENAPRCRGKRDTAQGGQGDRGQPAPVYLVDLALRERLGERIRQHLVGCGPTAVAAASAHPDFAGGGHDTGHDPIADFVSHCAADHSGGPMFGLQGVVTGSTLAISISCALAKQ